MPSRRIRRACAREMLACGITTSLSSPRPSEISSFSSTYSAGMGSIALTVVSRASLIAPDRAGGGGRTLPAAGAAGTAVDAAGRACRATKSRAPATMLPALTGAAWLCASTIALRSSAATPKRIRESPNSPRIAISGTAAFHHENLICVRPVPPAAEFSSTPVSGILIAAPPTPRTW